MLKDANGIKILHFEPRNDREHRLAISMQAIIYRSAGIDSLHTQLYSHLSSGDLNPVFGYRPSEFYDFELSWYHLRIYHKDRDGRRKRVLLCACLSGMQHQLPEIDLDPICRTKKTA